MSWSKVAKGVAVVALLSSGPTASGAMEFVGGSSPDVQMQRRRDPDRAGTSVAALPGTRTSTAMRTSTATCTSTATST